MSGNGSSLRCLHVLVRYADIFTGRCRWLNISDFHESFYDVRRRFITYLMNAEHLRGCSAECVCDTIREFDESECRDLSYPNSLIFLGSRELAAESNSFGFISPGVFVSAFSVLAHESWHACQMHGYHVRQDAFDCELAVSRLAAFGGNDFYNRCHAFFRFETDANLNGYLLTRQYLGHEFDCGVEDMLVDLYNSGRLFRETKAQFDALDVKVGTISDLSNVLFNANGCCSDVRKQYAIRDGKVRLFAQDDSGHVDKDAELKALKSSKDLFARTITGRRWRDVLDAYLTSTSAEDVDRMVACVNLYVNPWYLRKIPILKQVDLSPETVFGFSFRERPESVLQRISGRGGFLFGRSSGQVPPGRDTSDLDQAFESITRRDVGPGPDYDIS